MNTDDGIHTKGGEVSMSRKSVRLMAALLVLLSMVPASSWAFGGPEGGRRGSLRQRLRHAKKRAKGLLSSSTVAGKSSRRCAGRWLYRKAVSVDPKEVPPGELGMSSEANRQPLKNGLTQ
jgi:hypothetical protein